MTGAAPLIGIVSNFRSSEQEYFVPRAYVDAVTSCGGRPVMLPYDSPARALGLVDGLLLTGGTDFSPDLYGGRHHPAMSEILGDRDAFEVELTRAALGGRTPILAVCRGMQLVNVLRGGALFDHTLDDRPEETQDHRDGTPLAETVHDVRLAGASRLRTICGVDETSVNSMHHQAVSRLGADLIASAFAPDGVVEALEDPSHPFLIGVQWHPERRLQDLANRQLFEGFIAASRVGGDNKVMRPS